MHVRNLRSRFRRFSGYCRMVCVSMFVVCSADTPLVVAQAIPPVNSLVSEKSTTSELESLVQPLAETTVAIGPLRFIGFSPDGASIRVGSTQGRFQQLSTDDLKPIKKIKSLPPFGVVTSVLSRDHRLLIVGGWKGAIVMLDHETDAIRAQLPVPLSFDPTAITSIALTDDASHCIAGNRSSIVRMYRIATSAVVWESDKLEQDITGVSVSKNGKYVAVSSGVLGKTNEPGKIVVLDGLTGKLIYSWLDTASRVNHVAIANDSKTLLAAENSGVRIYDLSKGQPLRVIPGLSNVQRFKFIDDSQCAVSRFPAGLCLIDVPSGQTLVEYAAHKRETDPTQPQLIWALDVSLDGKKLASADSLGQVYLWPIP